MPTVKTEQLKLSFETLMEKSVLFSGRRLPLSSLLPFEENNNQWLEDSSLYELQSEVEPVIDSRPPEPHYSRFNHAIYIERRLVRSVEILQAAFRMMEPQSLCFSLSDFTKQVELHPKQSMHLLSTIEQKEAGVVDRKIKRYAWKKSHGGIGKLRCYICHDSTFEKHEWIKDVITEKDLISTSNDDNKLVIIVGPEGTGKSTLLSYLTELILQTNDEVIPRRWPIRINLNEHSFLNEIREFSENESAIKLLINHLIRWPRQQTNNLAKSLLRHRLLTPGGRVFLMFDGLDEIGVKAQDTIINLVEALSYFEGVERIIVTGRSRSEGQASARLEDKVNQLSYQLTDFNRSDKIKYLGKFWKFHSAKELESCTANDEAIEEYACEVIAIKLAETGEETFGNWPFQCKMLAEIFNKDLLITLRCRNTKVANPITEHSFSYLDLYRLFWAAKCDAFYSRIVTIVPLDVRSREDAVNVLSSYLLRIAIKFLFSPTEAAVLFYHCDDPPKWIAHSQDVVDSLCLTRKTSEGLVKLTHPLLPDYLVAEFLFKNLQQEKSSLVKSSSDFIIGKILVEPEFKGIRVFLDSMLESALPHGDYCEPFRPGLVPPVLSHVKFNDRLVELGMSRHKDDQVDDRGLTLCIAGRERNVGILSWLFFCAKEALMRANSGLKWHESMLNFLNPGDSTFIHMASPYHEVDVQVSERVFRWFEHADSKILKELLDCSKEVTLHPKVVFDFITRHRASLDADYLAGLLFQTDERFNLADMLREKNFFDDPESSCVDLIVDYLKQVFSGETATVKSWAVEWFLKLDWGTAMVDGALFKLLQLLVNHLNLSELDVRRVVSHALKMDAEVLTQPGFSLKEEMFSLKDILKRDVFGLTNLHKAAMYGLTGALKKMLIEVSKGLVFGDTLAEEITNGLTRDLFGITPLYVAARCGHEDTCEAIIRFLHSTLPFETVKARLTDPRGCLYSALTDAVPQRTEWGVIEVNRCNLEAIQSTAVLVLRHYGKDALLSLLVRESWSLLKSLFENLDDSSAVSSMLDCIQQLLGMHGLSFIICNHNHLKIVARLADESQNELLELILESILTCRGDVALVDFLLADRGRQHHNGRDLVENVMCILSNPVVQCYLPGKLYSAGLERLVECLTAVNPGADLEKGHSIWCSYCTHITKPLSHVEAILQSVVEEPGLGERKAKQLVLHDDGCGSVLELVHKRGWMDFVQVMLKNLPTLAKDVLGVLNL